MTNAEQRKAAKIAVLKELKRAVDDSRGFAASEMDGAAGLAYRRQITRLWATALRAVIRDGRS